MWRPPAVGRASALYAQAHQAYQRGSFDESLQILDQLVRLAPAHADGWNLAAVICLAKREFEAASRYFRRSLELKDNPGVRVNLGLCEQKQGRLQEARASYEAAARQAPGLALPWQKLGGLHELQGRLELARDSYRRAVELDAADLRSRGDGLYVRRHLAEWSDDPALSIAATLRGFAEAQRTDFSPGLLLSLPEATAADHLHAASLFAKSQWAGVCAQPALAAAPTSATGRRLRIGYVSADFRNHAVAFLVRDVIAAHDRDRVEVFLYGYRTPPEGDAWRQACVDAADSFVDIDGLDDAAAASRIHADGVDVLIDLTGYTGQGRPGINARRPAPTIAQWIGYIGTLGNARLADYVIGDAIATPLEHAAHFSEKLAWLPCCFQPNQKWSPLAAPPSRASQGLPDDALVLCSFNQTYKLNPLLWDDWCEVLRGLPDSVLWLAAPKAEAAIGNLRAEAERRGVDGRRIQFANQVSREEHLARLQLADIALDTWPYNSGTTASDAIRAGVPMVAMLGDQFSSRMAGSLLTASGLADCIATDRADCVRRLLALGRGPETLAALRRRVHDAALNSRLFDPAAAARDLEALLLRMHEQALLGLRDHIQSTE